MRFSIIASMLYAFAIAISNPCSAGEFGFMKDFGPFQPGQYPKSFPLNELSVSTIKDTSRDSIKGDPFEVVFEIAGFQDAATDVRVIWREAGCEILLAQNGAQHTYPNVCDIGSPSQGLYAWNADLNADAKQDLVIVTPAGACGIGGAIAGYSILLSTADGFRPSFLVAFSSDEGSFIDLDNDGKPEFILSSFVYGEEGKDGKKHNYFIYNLLKFEGDEIVSANAIDERFPSWILYSFKPNHKSTDQLTSEQKRRLWRERHQQDYDKLPVFKALEAEQGNPK